MKRAVAVAAVAAGAIGACDGGGMVYIGRQVDAVERSDASTSVDACVPISSQVAIDYCGHIPPLASAPAIDGVLDCGLPLASVPSSAWRGAGAKPDDLAVDYAAGWRPDGLYVFVHVRESQRLPAPPNETRLFCGDACHLFVDDDGRFAASPAYDTPGTRQLVAAAPSNDTDPIARGTLFTPVDSAPWLSSFRAFPTPDGYVLEAFVTATDLARTDWSLSAGARVGFDLSIGYGGTPSEYPDPTCAKRGDFVLRRDPSDAAQDDGMPHSDTGAFCTPQLDP